MYSVINGCEVVRRYFDIGNKSTDSPAMELDAQPRQHICHCGKRFVRNEHLVRHQAIHREPTFACSLCGRKYSRE
jgi:hypothetical protein